MSKLFALAVKLESLLNRTVHEAIGKILFPKKLASQNGDRKKIIHLQLR